MLQKIGAGTQTLSNYNTFTGGTAVDSGILNLAAGGAAGTIRGTATVNTGGTLRLSAGNSLGYSSGTKMDTLNIVGGLVDNVAGGDNGWGIAINLTGGTLRSNGGISSSSTGQLFSLGGGSSINVLASSTTSVIAGRVNLREGNPGNVLPFTVADGAAAVDLLVSRQLPRGHGLRRHQVRRRHDDAQRREYLQWHDHGQRRRAEPVLQQR